MKKLRQKGFTLAELLVAVAIIGVLVAVSIPIFSSQTEKAKAATDMANVRAAKAAAVADYLTGGTTEGAVYYYDAASGTVTTDATAAAAFKGYGKSSKEVSNATGIPNENGTAHIVCITIKEDGTQTASWTLGTGGGSTDSKGKVILTDDQGNTHTVIATTTWDDLERKVDGGGGLNIDRGTVFSDSEGNEYLYFDWDGYANIKGITASEFLTKYPNRVLKLQKDTPVLTEKDINYSASQKWNPPVSKGALLYFKGVLYVNSNVSNTNDIPPHNAWVAVNSK